MEDKRCELLAPAGNIKCFYAAMNAGADAVYLGLNRFGARAYAANFNEDELIEALECAHILGRKIYLTVNTLFKDSEIDELYDLLYKPYICGLDGVIVQDIGVMSYISEAFRDLPIHVSTQSAVTTAKAAKIFENLNVTRLVPARELSLDEIKKLKKESGLEIECFIHGSMCYSYSGKCLLSSMIGGRSGNRGRCGQPCRLLYDNAYLLSLKDMCTLDILPELIKAGISSFKIEGRMKSSDYVYAVTSIYRKYIDMYYNGSFHVDGADRERLVAGYTRSGSCIGYYRQHNGKDMITPDSPSYETGAPAAEDGITDKPEIGVKIRCSLHAGERAHIQVFNESITADATTDVIPDKAKEHPLTIDGIKEQLLKSGGTGLRIEDARIDADNDLFIPKSLLNKIRRNGIDAFKKEALSGYLRDGSSALRPVSSGSFTKYDLNDTDKIAPPVNVSVLTKEQMDAALLCGCDGIIIPQALFANECMSGSFDPKGKIVYIALPYVVRDDGGQNSAEAIGEFIEKCRKYDIAGFYISNNESLQILKDSGFGGRIIGDVHLYCYNRRAYDHYMESGVSVLSVPLELNARDLKERAIKGEELMIYGRIPVMISANCIRKTTDKCRKDDKGHFTYITDRKDEKLFVYCNCKECTNVIYNSAVLSISDEKKLIYDLRPSSVRLSFTDESKDETKHIIERYLSIRNTDGSTDERLIDRYTRGHINRGVE